MVSPQRGAVATLGSFQRGKPGPILQTGTLSPRAVRPGQLPHTSDGWRRLVCPAPSKGPRQGRSRVPLSSRAAAVAEVGTKKEEVGVTLGE